MKKGTRWFCFIFVGLILLALFVSASNITLPTKDPSDDTTNQTDEPPEDLVYYPISTVLSNVTANSANATCVSDNFKTVTLKFTANEGYSLPAEVTVTGCEYLWMQSSGTLLLCRATDSVTVTISAVEDSTGGGDQSGDNSGTGGTTDEIVYYPITTTLSNVKASSSNAATAWSKDEIMELEFTAATGYELPNEVTVTGCSYLWNQSTGTLHIAAATGDVHITITASEWTYSITTNVTNVVADAANADAIYGSLASYEVALKFAAADGYELPDIVEVTGCSYTWNKSLGYLYIYDFTGDVTITITGVEIVSDTPEVTTYGTYLFNNNFDDDELIAVGNYPNYRDIAIRFECDGKQYAHIFIWNDYDEGTVITYMPEGYSLDNYEGWLFASEDWDTDGVGDCWKNESYRLITLLEDPSEEALSFLTSYSVKQ